MGTGLGDGTGATGRAETAEPLGGLGQGCGWGPTESGSLPHLQPRGASDPGHQGRMKSGWVGRLDWPACHCSHQQDGGGQGVMMLSSPRGGGPGLPSPPARAEAAPGPADRPVPAELELQELCADASESTELDELWASLLVFVILFLVSVSYGATASLFKVGAWRPAARAGQARREGARPKEPSSRACPAPR